AMRWIEVIAALFDGVAPRFFADDRDLPPAALIGATFESASGDERRLIDAIHRAAMRALDPNCDNLSHFVLFVLFVVILFSPQRGRRARSYKFTHTDFVCVYFSSASRP